MSIHRTLASVLLSVAILATVQAAAPKQMTIQGRLTELNGAPVVGIVPFEFRMFNAEVGGTQIWPQVAFELQNLTVDSSGLWSTSIGVSVELTDAVFSDTVRWLQVTVDGTALPRVRLATGPFAFRVATVDGASGGSITSKVSVGQGHTNTGLDAFVAGSGNTVSGDRSFVGGGESNLASGANAAVVGGETNVAVGPKSFVGAGDENEATGDRSVATGGLSNSASGFDAYVGAGAWNEGSGDRSAVVGGEENIASGARSFVGGGWSNLASQQYTVIAGGRNNTADTTSAAIGGGEDNLAGNYASVVAGGNGNSALGDHSAVLGGVSNDAVGAFSTAGAGYANDAAHDFSTVVGGNGNRARGRFSFIGGGGGSLVFSGSASDSNLAREAYAVVVGGSGNRAEVARCFIGGGQNNVATFDGNPADVDTGSVIAGGRENTAYGSYQVIGGGLLNAAGLGGGPPQGSFNTVAGGRNNHAGAGGSFIGGGFDNTAWGNLSVVGGGTGNTVTTQSLRATIAGGEDDTASGSWSTVPGGRLNTAGGNYSFAAGHRAKARHAGSFVWADSSSSDFQSTSEEQFLIRATGGVGINHNAPTHALDVDGFTRLRTNNNTNLLVRDQSGQIDNVVLDFVKETDASESSARIAFDGFSSQATHRAHLRFYTRTTGDAAPLERMTISETGMVGIGDATPDEALDVVGGILATGCIVGSNIACPSDARLKEQITPLRGALDMVEQLQGVNYSWKPHQQTERLLPLGPQLGLIAQDVKGVVPQAVIEQSDGYLAVDYARLVPLLIEGMKEQQRLIEQQNERITQLEQRLEQ